MRGLKPFHQHRCECVRRRGLDEGWREGWGEWWSCDLPCYIIVYAIIFIIIIIYIIPPHPPSHHLCCLSSSPPSSSFLSSYLCYHSKEARDVSSADELRHEERGDQVGEMLCCPSMIGIKCLIHSLIDALLFSSQKTRGESSIEGRCAATIRADVGRRWGAVVVSRIVVGCMSDDSIDATKRKKSSDNWWWWW